MLFKKFDPVILPRLLFVAKGGERKDFANLLHDMDDDPLLISPEDIENCNGLTFPKVRDAQDGSYGVFVWINGKDNIKVICHEALHAANAIMNWLGMKGDTDNDEWQAYLVGWCVECIYDVCHTQ